MDEIAAGLEKKDQEKLGRKRDRRLGYAGLTSCPTRIRVGV